MNSDSIQRSEGVGRYAERASQPSSETPGAGTGASKAGEATGAGQTPSSNPNVLNNLGSVMVQVEVSFASLYQTMASGTGQALTTQLNQESTQLAGVTSLMQNPKVCAASLQWLGTESQQISLEESNTSAAMTESSTQTSAVGKLLAQCVSVTNQMLMVVSKSMS